MTDLPLRAWNWAMVDGDEREYWSVPSGDVFEFAFHLKKYGQKKVYDLGCGIGRNLFFLIDAGFDVYGSDFSVDAVNEVNRRLESINYPNRVKNESMTKISELGGSYDAVVAYNVVYHAYRVDMLKAMNNIYRILKPGGSLLITFQAKSSPIYNKDFEVEPYTVVKSEGAEAGIPHHLVDRDDILDMLSEYQIVNLSYVEHEYDWMKFKGCHFVVTAIKK
jgi:SAM-dependent methyltransferase